MFKASSSRYWILASLNYMIPPMLLEILLVPMIYFVMRLSPAFLLEIRLDGLPG